MRSALLLLMALALWLAAGCGGGFGGYPGSPAMEKAADMDMPAPMEPEAMATGAADFGPERAGGDEEYYAQAEAPPPPQAGEPPPPPPQPDVVGTGPDPVSPVKAQARQLLIYKATYHMAVYEATPAIDAVQKLAEEVGGYLVSRSDREITVRVPVDEYRGALNKVTALGDVLHREETVEDVTERFYDLMVRIKNARAMRDRMEQLLTQAKDVKEALAVERELGRITAEIESMEGRMRLLKELIAFSTITVRFEPRPTEQVNSQVRLPFPWLDQLGLSNLLSL
jgi:hypothetical protein